MHTQTTRETVTTEEKKAIGQQRILIHRHRSYEQFVFRSQPLVDSFTFIRNTGSILCLHLPVTSITKSTPTNQPYFVSLPLKVYL